MKYFTLLLVGLLLVIVASVQAGKVTIKGSCVDCNEPHTTTPRAQSGGTTGGNRRRPTTAKPKASATRPTPTRDHARDDDDDWSSNGWSLHQTIGGGGGSQHITGGQRHKRQWGGRQIIRTGDGEGGWGGGPITTIDSRGHPGTFVRNNDCVGCNIRG